MSNNIHKSGKISELFREAHFYINATLPLFYGFVVFVGIMFAAAHEDISSNFSLLPASPFHGAKVVYAMIFASLITVLTATFAYQKDLAQMILIAEKTAGRRQLWWAQKLILASIIILIAYFGVVLITKTNATATDACSLHILHKRVGWHDICVWTTFILFFIADILTLRGMGEANRACKENPNKKIHQDEIELSREFSKQQLWLVDFPVIIGAVVSIGIVFSATILQGWDDRIFYVDPLVIHDLATRRTTTLFMCSGQALDIREFQQSIASIFSAGIAMGYLAAHVLMSQVVFITLNIFFSRKRAQLYAASTSEPTPSSAS